MSKTIDKGWITLSVTRIVSIALAVFAVVLLFWAMSYFHDSYRYIEGANSYPNVAENQPHGLDSLSAILEGGFGIILLLISIATFILAFTIFFGTSWKLSKKATLDKQQSNDQVQILTPLPNRTITPQLDNKSSETTRIE